jgi:hypothetical protein
MTDPTEAYQPPPKPPPHRRDPYKGLLLTANVAVAALYGTATLLAHGPAPRLVLALTTAYGVAEFARILTSRND